MNTLRNRVQLIGHVGADPEIKNAQNGSKLAQVRVATTERYQSNGAWKEDTQWHRLTMWEKLAEKAENQLHKGSFVLVEGKILYRTYADAQGQTRYSTEIRVMGFVVLDKQPRDQNSMAISAKAGSKSEDDLPF